VERRTPPPHDLWQSHLVTGSLILRLEIPPDQYVSPATGRLGLVGDDKAEVVAQRAARLQGVPVLPGSGIKGAVRTLYELLSFSCDPFARDGRRGGSQQAYCSPQACCDACSLFGLLGYNGRLSFSDASPASAAAVQVEIEKVPVPWTPDPGKTRGDFRLYDLEEATQLAPGRRIAEKRPKELAREVYRGAFETRMSFANLEPQELGRVLLALGLGYGPTTEFLLRLGGVKYDGKGAVDAAPERLRLALPRPESLAGDECRKRCSEWVAAARASRWADSFWSKLEEVATVLQPSA
jgi:hypothetical protein